MDNFQKIVVKEYKKGNDDPIITLGFKRQREDGEWEGSWIAIPKSQIKNLVEELIKISGGEIKGMELEKNKTVIDISYIDLLRFRKVLNLGVNPGDNISLIDKYKNNVLFRVKTGKESDRVLKIQADHEMPSFKRDFDITCFTAQEIAFKKAIELSQRIDDELSLFFRKPEWCPYWIYKLLAKNFVSIVSKK